MKIGIRFSILALFVTLLITLGCVILSVDFIVSNRVLLTFSENLLQSASKNIEHETSAFLETIHKNLGYNAKLIEKGIITPSFSFPDKANKDFISFLIGIAEEQPSFFTVSWNLVDKNVVLIERRDDDYFNVHITYRKKNIEMRLVVDRKGNSIGNPIYTSKVETKPETRPWFSAVITKKKYFISDIYAYLFAKKLCLAGAYPVFGKNGMLLGMLETTVMAQSLSDFVSGLTITKNSHIFIFDDKDNLVAAPILKNYSSGNLLKISDMNIPWVHESFQEHSKNQKQLFSYSFKNKTYIAFFKKVENVELPWTIAIVLPISDVIGQFVINFIISSIIIAAVLILGILLIWFFSTAISKPIISLAQEAIDIKNMNFSHVTKIKSRIKEVIYMQESFTAMTQSIKSFIRYIPFTLVKNLISSGKIAKVGGEYKKITLMFADIHNFTSISENMPPHELTAYISEYFETMTKIILAKNGTLDKYMGDGIMAFWGAPINDEKHALHACQGALIMQKKLVDLNTHWQSEKKPSVSVRIGINTGDVIVGNIGSKDKLSYTAIGDGVNLSSRLQDLNKVYGTTIMISQTTYEIVKDNKELSFRFLDLIAVRGKHNFIYVYELLTNDHPLKQNLERYNIDFKNAFEAYKRGDWLLATTLFKQMKQQYPEDRCNVLQIFLERCFAFKNNPPEDWTGVWRF